MMKLKALVGTYPTMMKNDSFFDNILFTIKLFNLYISGMVFITTMFILFFLFVSETY